MCWSPGVTAAMVGAGVVATVVTARRGESPAIWGTFAYFTAMEALQVAGYSVIDQCDDPVNRQVTLLSYLHIALQPLVINLFAMALVGPAVTRRMRAWVIGLSGLAALSMMARLLPEAGEACRSGQVLCGARLCTISGEWHLGWEVPWYDLWGALPWPDIAPGLTGFPDYMAAALVLPALYGAWRFALFHLVFGPTLAWALTNNPNEMPAIWCLFSISILAVALCPPIRRGIAPPRLGSPG